MKETVQKPWGWYKDLERHYDLVIKKLYIKPLSRFSLQKHFKRDEFWYIISGTGTITIDSLKPVSYTHLTLPTICSV